jgi:hypothetical protein
MKNIVMTQENKELLLKDLCARLPYGVKVKIKYHDDAWKLLAIYTNDTTYATRDVGYPIETYFENCKPYLFPLSSMTEDQKKEYRKVCELDTEILSKHPMDGSPFPALYNSQDWLNKNHFDYRGLIKKGLAIDCANLNNIY